MNFRQHSYAFLRSAVNKLHRLGARECSELLRRMVYGLVPGVVCTRCGVSLVDLCSVMGLVLVSDRLVSLRCVRRPSAERMQQYGTAAEGSVLYDDLSWYGELESTDAVRMALGGRLLSGLPPEQVDLSSLPVLG